MFLCSTLLLHYYWTRMCFLSLSCLLAPVRPDPPVAVNWTLLSESPYGPHYDVIVSWEPPPSADVRMGWMRLAYEVQYRRRNTSEWTVVSSPLLLSFCPLLSFSFCPSPRNSSSFVFFSL